MSTKQPRDFLQKGLELQQAGRAAEAKALYLQLLQDQPGQPDALHLLGLIDYQEGDFETAARLIGKAVEAKPDFAPYRANLASALHKLGRLDDAAIACRRAVELDPGLAAGHNNLANILRDQGQLEGAEESLRRAREADPKALDPMANLAALLEETNQTSEASALAAEGLAQATDHPLLNLVAAKCARRAGETDAAIRHLTPFAEAALGADLESQVHYELGLAHDRAGDADSAFAHFERANARAAEKPASRRHDKEAFLALVRAFHEVATSDWQRSWTPDVPCPAEETPVFLIGFPRSGTTLMDQILDGHPQIQVVEEPPTAAKMAGALAADGDYPACLAALDQPRIGELRRLYHDTVAGRAARQAGTLLVDKMPLNIVNLPLLRRVFPSARYILALRHPMDACLSCLMQNFRINDAMANFFTLEDTANAYARVMGLWLHYRETLPVPHHAIKYENLVQDFRGEVEALLDFLGLPWDPAMEAHASRAAARGRINTPSYEQVTEAIYTRASGRWRRYEAHLAPVAQTLQPYMEAFGYT